MALQISVYSIYYTSIPLLFIWRLFSLSCLVAMERFSFLGGLFSSAVSTAVSIMIVVRLLIYVSRSSVVSSCRASNLLVSSSWNSAAFSESTAYFGFFWRLVSLARSRFVLIINVPRTMRWSLLVLNLLITDTIM